ncbi:hypothetical protein NQ315_013610 [Exocentrus adspersus]|uniref:Uncharacterized protein n=1 Tax=Exocentrus adspersus TaxID=1586481 RepID=A0AAV8W3S7_9CUCU|nr:hypothetical protein NQ315_013610 [Exocentrus adspersus]
MLNLNNDKKFVCKETFWWEGFEIIPPRPKMGLLSAFANRKEEISTSEESTEEEEEEESTSSTSSDSEEGSAESNPAPKKVMMVRKKSKKKKESKLWQQNLSARNNQDIQRAYEEIAVKEMTAILNRNSLNENVRSSRNTSRNTTPLGGVWVRLEAEWKESCTQVQQQKQKKHLHHRENSKTSWYKIKSMLVLSQIKHIKSDNNLFFK